MALLISDGTLMSKPKTAILFTIKVVQEMQITSPLTMSVGYPAWLELVAGGCLFFRKISMVTAKKGMTGKTIG